MIAAIGLDIGRKRIGVAGCDGLGLIATGLTTIEHRSFDQTVEQLRQIVQDRRAEILVAGLPYRMNGELNQHALQTQKFANRLASALQLPIEFVDERLTSYEAEEQMISQGRSLRHEKGLVDRKAAAIILQQWLDERRSNLAKL